MRLNVNPLESKVEGNSVKRAKSRGWKSIKLGKNGWPDRLFLKKRIALFVEFKRKGSGRLTELQKKKIRELREEGFIVEVCDDVDDFLMILSSVEPGSNVYPGCEGL